MKKALFTLLLILAVIFTLGCSKEDENTIIVGASSTPHAEILEQVKETLKKEGYTLKIVVYDDYILPNKALTDKELDANYFQHTPYLNSYNKSNNTDIEVAFKVHYEPFGLYGNGISNLNEVTPGTKIIIPADDSNETRALLLLKQAGLITLNSNKTVETGITTLDIENNNGYEIIAVQADSVAAQLKNSTKGTLAVINGNYALEANLKIIDAIIIEDASGDAAQYYANVIAVRKGDKDSPKIKALIDALNTEKIKKYINDSYNGAVVPIF
jgi:D-methionine transport system substrate-binding protein